MPREFFVTKIKAEHRLPKIRDAAIMLGSSPSIIDVAKYSPWQTKEFGAYLEDNGIEHFSVAEAVTPNDPPKAKEAGYDALVPPNHLWPLSLLVLRIGDMMRKEIGEPIRLRNLYRPFSYNQMVADSDIKSDHPNACGGDFDFKSVATRRKAEGFVRTLSMMFPLLELSLGMGAKTLHIGLLSPLGHRHWFYPSYSDPKRKVLP
jgi:hypothetical protein